MWLPGQCKQSAWRHEGTKASGMGNVINGLLADVFIGLVNNRMDGRPDRMSTLRRAHGDFAFLNCSLRVAKLPMVNVLRARTTSETRGFMKAVVAADSGRILGFTMLGAVAGEVMAVVQTAMLAGMPYTGLRDAIIAHPTTSEGLGALFSNVAPRSMQTERVAA